MASALFDNTVCLDIQFHKPGDHRKGSLKNVQVDAEKRLLGLTKKIFESATYKEIVDEIEDCKQYLLDRSINNTLLKKAREERNGDTDPDPDEGVEVATAEGITRWLRAGCYLIPLENLQKVYTRCEQSRDRIAELADKFILEYTGNLPPGEDGQESLGLVVLAKKELRSQFDSRNYPRPELMRSKFGVDWRLVEFGTPNAAKLGEVLYEQELAKVQESLVSAEQELVVGMRVAMLELVSHLADMLTLKPNGKRKRLAPSAVENLTTFLEHFSSRNVMNDTQLATLAEEAREVIKGKDVKALRKGEALRTQVREGMEKIKGSLDKLVSDQGRAISFDEED